MKKIFFGILLAFFLLSSLPIFAQQLPPQKHRTKIAVIKKGSKTYFKVEGAFNYPERTVLVLAIRYEDGGYIKWYNVPLKNKKFSAKLGPFKKKLIPGAYILETWFKIAVQPIALSELLRTKYKYSPNYSHKVDDVYTFYGSEAEEVKAFKELGKEYLVHLEKVRTFYKIANKKFSWTSLEKEPKAPRKTEWKNFIKTSKKDYNKFQKKIWKWEKGYISMYRGDWAHILKMSCNDLTNLWEQYSKIYTIEVMKDKKAKDLKMRVYYFECKNARIAFENTLNNLEREINKLLKRKVNSGKESGVE